MRAPRGLRTGLCAEQQLSSSLAPEVPRGGEVVWKALLDLHPPCRGGCPSSWVKWAAGGQRSFRRLFALCVSAPRLRLLCSTPELVLGLIFPKNMSPHYHLLTQRLTRWSLSAAVSSPTRHTYSCSPGTPCTTPVVSCRNPALQSRQGLRAQTQKCATQPCASLRWSCGTGRTAAVLPAVASGSGRSKAVLACRAEIASSAAHDDQPSSSTGARPSNQADAVKFEIQRVPGDGSCLFRALAAGVHHVSSGGALLHACGAELHAAAGSPPGAAGRQDTPAALLHAQAGS